MAPIIHLVRHAQGFHNLCVENEQLPDPDLTDLGKEQCAALHAEFPHHDKITKLIASPMRRTVYTCLYAFGTDKLMPVIALPVLQEVSQSPCDTGSPVAKVRAEFEGKVDYSAVEETWTDKGPNSEYEPVLEKLLARGLKARKTLRDIAGQGDDHIVVTSHGAILHYLTDDWEGIPQGHATGWLNCEYRSYQFADPTGKDDDAKLVETQESWQRRNGDATRPSENELR